MNKVELIGRLTKDPELKFTAGNGDAVCKFTLAVNRFKKNEADFINCVAFKKTAETISQYVTKGKQIGVTGNIRTGSYESQDGTKRYTTDICVENFEFLGSNNDNSFNENSEGNGSNLNNGYKDIEPVDDGDMPF